MFQKYYDDDGGIIFTSCGISKGEEWMTVRQKSSKSGTHRIKSPKLPIRKTQAEAQEDLDVYAILKGWEKVE